MIYWFLLMCDIKILEINRVIILLKLKKNNLDDILTIIANT